MGCTVEAGVYVGRRERATRRVRWEEADEELHYDANQLDRAVVAARPDPNRDPDFQGAAIHRDLPGRTEVPKTLIFAKDDSHADDIVQIVREEFGKGNDFAAKITYRRRARSQRTCWPSSATPTIPVSLSPWT